jgi:putative acetyltransferase
MSALTIRRARTDDALALAGIMSHPDVLPGLLQVPYNDAAVWTARLNDLFAPGKPDLLLVAERDGKVVGNCGIHPAGAQLRRRHAWHIGMAVAPEAQRQGVGSALLAAICDYADNWAGALRLELGVFTDNAAAIALYKKFGFEIEGTQRAYALRNGEYADTYLMARLHPNPPRVGN